MTLPTYYVTGTASVANGSTSVTGASSGWGTPANPVILAGDYFMDPAQPEIPPQRIASVESNGELTLAVGWPGTSLTDDPYEIRFVGIVERSTAQTRRYYELLGQLSPLGLQPDAFGLLVDRDAYDDEVGGFLYLALDSPWTLYIKLTSDSADWDDGQTVEGGVGPDGDRGWSPVYAVVTDGARRVKQLVGYVGGEGTEPTDNVGDYVGPLGYVELVGDGTDVRGPTGSDGADPGLLLTSDDGTADADPGSGNIRADNVDLSAAGELFVSKTNRAGSDIATYLLGLADSTTAAKGRLLLTDPATEVQAGWIVTGVTDSTGYVKVAVSSHFGATSFADGIALSLQFNGTGNAGAGTGDVVGPGSSVNNRIALFDGTTGKAIKDSGALVGDFATAAQGALADSALQSSDIANMLETGDIGVSVQAYDAQLSSLVRQNSQSDAYTLVLTDGGKHIYHPSADTTARVWTIPANSSVAFPIGTAVTFDNDFGAGAITISITDDTLVLVGAAGSTGSRTLASGGQATAIKVSSTRWRISGVGLT